MYISSLVPAGELGEKNEENIYAYSKMAISRHSEMGFTKPNNFLGLKCEPKKLSIAKINMFFF